jgi:hypothetical protein
MKKLIIALAALALVVPAFCAVENIKVGGDLTFIGVERNNFDLLKGSDDGEHFIYSGVRVYVSADLSNKVSTMVRFITENDFGMDEDYYGYVPQLDLAYVKLSDILTPGLSLTVGRQEIQIGEGLVVGSRYRVGDYYAASQNSLYYGEDLGQMKAFDAVKLDYAFQGLPLSVSAFKAKIAESYGISSGSIYIPISGWIYPDSDLDLLGISFLWKGEQYSLEPYYVDLVAYGQDFNIQTAGIRGTWNPAAVKGLALKAEYAKQFGNVTTGFDAAGWAGYIGASYEFATNMKPTIYGVYNYFSGISPTSTDMDAWIPVFPSNIASRVGKIAYEAIFPAGETMPYYWYTGTPGFVDGLASLKLGVSLNPTEKLGVSLDWFNLTALETFGPRKGIGNEIDLGLTYAYTEDVALGLDIGYFMAGDNVKDIMGSGNEEDAWQLLGSIKIAF